ncbi:predicted protein, partial [Arabidopsis lyrata subsp. lyrata]
VHLRLLDPPAFVGSTPSLGLEAIFQQRRWSTGEIEVLFNKQSPLIGMFRRKIKFRQRLAYFWALMCIRSIPELVYCLLPAYSLLHNSALFPKLLGISKIGFIVAKKTMPDKPTKGEDDGPKSDLRNFEFDSSHHFIPGTFILFVNLAALAIFFVGQQRSSCSHEGGGSGLAEACGCILVVMLFFPFLKGLFEHGKYGIPLCTLSKAAFLTVLFVVFSLGK